MIHILNSVGKNSGMLMQAGLLGMLFLYLYTMVGFLAFNEEYNEGMCDDMWRCLLHHMNIGLRSGGGIGDAMDGSTSTDFLSRLIFDFSFWMILIVILIAIVSGVIIDTFGEMRDSLKAKKAFMQHFCFICGLENSEFERNLVNFRDHTSHEHGVLDYVWLLLHVKNKMDHGKAMLTGQEGFVDSHQKAGTLEQLFPVGQAMCLMMSDSTLDEDVEGESDDGDD
jgi:hypothetical protein